MLAVAFHKLLTIIAGILFLIPPDRTHSGLWALSVNFFSSVHKQDSGQSFVTVIHYFHFVVFIMLRVVRITAATGSSSPTEVKPSGCYLKNLASVLLDEAMYFLKSFFQENTLTT